MSDLSAVMGASTTVKTMADGSLRLAIDIEPRHAQAAFALFGSPGTPVALARITNEAANAHDQREPEPDKPKGGALAKLAGMLGADPEFWKFLTHQFTLTAVCESDATAAEVIREVCEIESRSELDWHTDAADRFHVLIRGPWIKWRTARGLK
jgi:hypothetical protein